MRSDISSTLPYLVQRKCSTYVIFWDLIFKHFISVTVLDHFLSVHTNTYMPPIYISYLHIHIVHIHLQLIPRFFTQISSRSFHMTPAMNPLRIALFLKNCIYLKVSQFQTRFQIMEC